MLKIRAMVPVAALAVLAACGGEEAAETQGEADAVAEPTPGAVVTEPVSPATGDSMVTMPAGATTDTGAAATTTTTTTTTTP